MPKFTITERFWNKVNKNSGIFRVVRGELSECWIWTGATGPRGYGYFVFVIGLMRMRLAHRVSYYLNVGEFDQSLDICHHCDNPPCIRPDHLFTGTTSANMLDAASKNRFHGPARLSVKEVQDIRTMYSEKAMTQREIAALFGVGREAVSKILTGKNWKHAK